MRLVTWFLSFIIVALVTSFSPSLQISGITVCGPTPAYADHVPCCRYCSTGKACGNSCISRSKTCRVGHGCACDARTRVPDVALAPDGDPITQ